MRSSMKEGDSVHERLDKWLNYACLYKTRAKATHACDDRRIKVNGEVAKPAKPIKAGDQLTIKKTGGQYVEITVLQIVHRNVSIQEARTLYDQKGKRLSEEARDLMELLGESFMERRPKYKGRPTKKERRRLEDLKRRHSI